MNMFNYTRRLAQGVLMLCMTLVALTGVQAQCGDFLSEPSPVTAPVNITVNLTGTTAALTNALIQSVGVPNFSKQGACDYQISDNASFPAGPNTITLPDANYFDCADVSVAGSYITRYLQVVGAGGPSVSTGNFREIRFYVVDDIPPVATAPALVNPYSSTAGLCTFSPSAGAFDAIATDNCSVQSVTYTLTGVTTGVYTSTLNGVLFNSGLTNVSVTVVDVSGNSSVAINYTINVVDTQAPVRTALCTPSPLAITIPADAGTCTYNASLDPRFDAINLFSDNCGTAGLTYQYGLNAAPSISTTGTGPASLVFPLGSSNIRYRATDASLNISAICRLNITITDTQVPTLTNVPSNGTASTNNFAPLCEGDYAWTHPTAADNCSIASQTYTIDGPITDLAPTAFLSGANEIYNFELGTSIVTYTVTDGAGLVTTASFTVVITDQIAPDPGALTPILINQPVVPTTCSKTLPYTRRSVGVVTDCGPVTITETILTTAPYISADPTVFAGQPAFNTTTGGGTITVQFPAGHTYIQYCWVDNANNKTCIIDDVFIDEDIDPIAICQNRTINLDAIGTATLLATNANNGSSDNCPAFTLALNSATGLVDGPNLIFDCSDLGANTFTLVATDAAGNINTSTPCTVTVLDLIAPVVNCPANVSVVTGATTCNANIGSAGNLAFDLGGAFGLGEYDNNCDLNSIAILATANNGADLNGATAGVSYTIAGIKPTADLSSAVFQKGLTTINYSVSDLAGNVSNCNFTVNVVDQTPPTLTVNTTPAVVGLCSGGIIIRNVNTVSCNYITPPATPLWTASASDPGSCSLPVNLTTLGGSPTGTYPQGDSPISITAVDAAGNVSTCTFTIRVRENAAPTAICKDTTVNLSNAPMTLFAPTFNNNSTDNCTLGSSLSLALLDGSNAVIPSISVAKTSCTDISVKLRVTDFNGNSSTCTAKIIVNDNVTPDCRAKNISVNLDAAGSVTVPAAAINDGSNDNCTATGSLVLGISKTNGSFTPSISYNCTNAGTTTPAFLQVTDAKGNVSVCSSNVTVIDNIAPIGNGPADIVLACQDVAAYLLQPITITAVENCTFTVTGPTSAITPLASPSCPNHYKIIRSWTVTDASGLTDLVQQVITVEDNTKPTIASTLINNTAQILLSATPGICFPTATYTVAVTDNCSGALTTTWSVLYADGFTDAGNGTSMTGQFAIGANTITFVSTDACGNSNSLALTINVVDNVAPIITNTNFSSGVNLNCGQNLVFSNSPSTCGYSFQWVRPSNGNVSECDSYVWSAESIVAVVNTPTGPQNQTITSNIPWNPSNPLTEFLLINSSLPVGVTTFNYVVTDDSNNSSACTFKVTVNDTQTPVLTGATTTVLNTVCPTQTIGDFTGLVNVADNCTNITLTQTPPANTLLSALTYLPTPLIPAPDPTDGSQFVVTITATDGTNVSLPRNITVTLDDNSSPIPTQNALPDVSSNCGYIIVTAPTAEPNCVAGPLIYGTPGGAPATAETVSGSNITSYRIILPGNQLPCQTYFVTWSYNDGSGNVSTQLQKVTICPDVTAPTAVCKTSPISVTLAPTTATLNIADVNNGSFDLNNCNPFTLAIAKGTTGTFGTTVAFSCTDVSPDNTGSTTVVLRATDNANAALSTTCTVQVKVLDNIAPTLTAATVPANITLNICSVTDQGQIPVPATVTATDNCSATVAFNQVSTQATTGLNKYNYVITRTWTAKDVFGNTSSASQTITVRDNVKPVFATIAPANLIFSTAPASTNCNGQIKLNVANFVSDCAPDAELSIVVNPAYFSLTDSLEVLPVGTHVVNFTVTDPAGNSATTSLTFVVNDVTKPTANCINGISVALNANGQAIVTPNLINNQSSDNCTTLSLSNLKIQELDIINGDTIGTPGTQLIFDCEEADNDTEYPIILIVTDAAGNFSFCETSVVIQDNQAPTVTCPSNKTVECSQSLTAFAPAVLGNASATDNCPQNITLTFTDTPVNNGYLCGNFVRRFTATDLSNNTATCTQSITVIDTKPPVFSSLPQGATISCNDPLVNAPVLTATDNCTPQDSIKIVYTEIKTPNPLKSATCGLYDFSVTRTWKATDKCGNTSTHTQVVVVRDTIAPKFFGMPSNITVQSANFPSTSNCTVPVVLNAGAFWQECSTIPQAQATAPFVISFSPTFLPAITPSVLDVSGNYPVGTTKVFFTATDACNNVGKDTVTITVIDNSAPTAICNNNVVISLGTNGQATLSPNDINLNSSDNCALAVNGLTLDQTQFDCSDLGFNDVTLTVTDVNGNSNSCTVSVEVVSGSTSGFTLTSTGSPTTYFGATNGTALASATGGSNTFTYLWNTGATTASISGLAAGTYTVTATDAFTGCMRSDTAIVVEGPKVKFTIGNATGTQGTIVKVPVFASNFTNVSGFSFSVDLTNLAVGQITSPIAITDKVPALGAALQGSPDPTGSTLSILYLNPQGQNISLPNNTLLFNICIQLSGAALGTTSPLVLDGTPVQFTLLRETANGPAIVPAESMNGSVQITLGLNDYDIAGDIAPWQAPTTGIPNVVVNLTVPTTPQTVTTTTTGIYQFVNIPAATNTLTTPSKTQSGNAKIDIIDQGLLLKHIFANSASPSPLTSPYQRVAADVNFDGQINIVDFARIQRLLLGTVQNLEGTTAKDWVFIPESYTFPASTTEPFPNPTYTAIPVFPRTIGHNPIFQDQLDDDFIGVRMGDLNGDAPLQFQQSTIDDRGSDLMIRIQDRAVAADEVITVPFKAKDFNNRLGYQFTLQFDPTALELQNIEQGNALPGLDSDANFGTTLLSEGWLSTAWVSADAVTVSDDETLFTLTFKALQPVNALSSILNTTADIVAPLALNLDGSTEGVDLEFTAAVVSGTNNIAADFKLYQNQPNPFKAETTIGFRLPSSERVTVNVYSVNGRLVKTFVGNYEKGYNAIQFRNSDLGTPGVYYYEIATPSYSDRKKMILID